MTAQRPQAVTLDRICEILDNARRDYVVDECSSGRMLLIPRPTATSYVDLVSGVLRVRSAWRGAIPAEDKPSLYPYIFRHNRETVGPKVMVFDYGDYLRISTQTSIQVSAGLGAQQLEANLLMALILVERFTVDLENEFDWVSLAGEDSFHRDALQKQRILQFPSEVSDNYVTDLVDASFVGKACCRLHLRTQRDGTVFRLVDAPELPNTTQETVLRLFGDDTWFSVSSLVRLPHQVPPEKLFLAVNNSNIRNALGEISVLGMRHFPYLRLDYLISIGEGLSEHQLDAQILVGVGVTTDLLRHLSETHPDFFSC